MREIDVVVSQQGGVHLRVAGAVARAVRDHQSQVKLSCADCPAADGCSILQLLMLGAPYGATVRVVADGPDEGVVIEKVSEILMDGAGI